jgi:uncharacterized repeat protein (TIGR03803 family)
MAKRMACIVFLLCAATSSASAQTFSTLVSFRGTDGADPYFMSLVQGANGELYGTTEYGGFDANGTIFKVATTGVLTSYSISSPGDGIHPYAGLLLGTDGNFYGTTTNGGAYGFGTVFKITPRGRLTTLHSFCPQPPYCVDGGQPWAGLIQGSDGNFYGTTVEYGVNHGGTVFKISPMGALTTLFSFCDLSDCTDGYAPAASLVQATDGNLYGVTPRGGDNSCNSGLGCGTIFSMTPAGKLTTLHRFEKSDGYFPDSELIQGSDGDLYGTTSYGGARAGCLPNSACGGTIFAITPASGILTTLYNFCAQTNCTDGDNPTAALVEATDGNFYGTTYAGGANSDGTIFGITPDGALTTLHSFDATGANPDGGLVQATNGKLYGTTYDAGPDSDGTVFSLDIGVGPFVQTLPTSRKVGAQVIILGNGLTGSTAVNFNGSPAAFTVVSDTEITVTVPAGATSGSVTVTTPSGTLTSNKPFRVIP